MYLRRLPSGKWQAVIRLPDGKRRTYTAMLKGEVKQWGTEQEARIRRGDWLDPRTSKVTYDDWAKRWWAARVVEVETRRGDESTRKNHLDPHWHGWSLRQIGRMDVQGWVRQMDQAGVGPHAIRHAYNLLTTMLGAAVLEGILSVTPCRKIDLPATPAKHPAWFTVDQADDIMEHLPERHRAAAALMFYTGLRWGEMAGLRIKDVDWLRHRVHVVGARTQLGAWKEHPKSSRSRREVPVPSWVMDLLRAQIRGRAPGETLFVTERGSHPWSGSNWRKVWTDAVKAAGAPPYSPHSCRHSCASWLVQGGVDLYRVQALLGHESFATTQRYAHLRPDNHDAVEQVWTQIATPRALESGGETDAQSA